MVKICYVNEMNRKEKRERKKIDIKWCILLCLSSWKAETKLGEIILTVLFVLPTTSALEVTSERVLGLYLPMC